MNFTRREPGQSSAQDLGNGFTRTDSSHADVHTPEYYDVRLVETPPLETPVAPEYERLVREVQQAILPGDDAGDDPMKRAVSVATGAQLVRGLFLPEGSRESLENEALLRKERPVDPEPLRSADARYAAALAALNSKE